MEKPERSFWPTQQNGKEAIFKDNRIPGNFPELLKDSKH